MCIVLFECGKGQEQCPQEMFITITYTGKQETHLSDAEGKDICCMSLVALEK